MSTSTADGAAGVFTPGLPELADDERQVVAGFMDGVAVRAAQRGLAYPVRVPQLLAGFAEVVRAGGPVRVHVSGLTEHEVYLVSMLLEAAADRARNEDPHPPACVLDVLNHLGRQWNAHAGVRGPAPERMWRARGKPAGGP